MNRRRKPVYGKPIFPSAALGTAYQARMDAQIDAMHGSLEYWLTAAWRANPPVLARDETPAAFFGRTMRKIGARWRRNFDTLADEMAAWFAQKADDRVKAQLKAMLRERGFTVRFSMTAAMRDAIGATVGENVALIRSIAEQHLGAVEGAVMRSIQAGRDLGGLAKELREAHGVTKRRAALIARHQNNMATATLTRVRQEQAGITKAKWLHSAGGKEPRPEHVAMSGKPYEVAKGAFLEGKWTWPGREINCRCVSVPLIDGFEE